MAPWSMGIAHARFYFYPATAATRIPLLVRVVRPTAPSAAEPAVEFAEALADAKAGALAWAWSGEAGPPTPLGDFYPNLDGEDPKDAELLAFHGRTLELWWTAEEQRPASFAIGPGADEEAFWDWLAASRDDDAFVARLRRPATRIHVRLVTEADARLVDTPLLLVDDVDWLTADEFARLASGGLAVLTARPPATTPAVTQAEFRAAKLALVERALAHDLAHGDRRSAAFRASELARFDPLAALALIERLPGSLKRHDDRKSIVWALAYALHRLRREPARADLLERWRAASDSLRSDVLAELAQLDRYP
ncbi:hypothetical protein [Nannocystis sp. SCPEA4]|uniref:hypothetical protein n=1 Tax=Nannocystis sp. SCPEA4 TaxID=2996787 RepID=UPI00227180A8|nr:hypothetical protein [Nannocystis sp. SCPEA4]MCY1060633.1 hypothetical protein [Nannocystis sp. SCPEA4]